MKITLTKTEARTFHDIINGELTCLVNEYDEDTRRTPSKARMKELPILKDVYYNWLNTQNSLGSTIDGWPIVDLDQCIPCEMILDKKQSLSVKKLMQRCMKDITDTLAAPQNPSWMLEELNRMNADISAIISKMS